MLHLIYGLSGTGKTTHFMQKIKENITSGQKAILIVPEQQTVEVERAMSALLPPSAQLIFEVVNFTRLANKLFRIYGGLSYHYITAGMKELFMWQALKALSPLLKEFGGRTAKDPTMPATLLSAISELKSYNITPEKLEEVSKKAEENTSFKNKLCDLSLIYPMYESMVRESYDDTSDDLAKLAELLEKNNFFEGYHVYIDSFTDFTAQEYRILKCILAQADEVYLSLFSNGPLASDLYLTSVNETSKRLRALVGEQMETVVLSEFHRFAAPELREIAEHLWHFHVKGEKKDEAPKTSDALTLMCCSDAYAEAKAAVAQILSLVQDHGYRFRDIAVVTRNAESYRGILDAELEKAGIPFFMSEKTDITTKPLISMIFSVLAIKQKSYRSEDVINYLKTGLSGFTPYEIDMFSTYVHTWRIHGKQFASEWTMNPDGFNETVSARGEVIRKTANAVRERLMATLSPFFLELDSARTLADFCNALYRFLKNTNVSETLKQYAGRALDEGDKKEAAETAGIFKAVFGVLSDMTAAMGDEEMELEEFLIALRLVFSKTELGTIPTAADEVLIGSASTLRATGVRCAILLGLCEGEFPMRVSEKGLFTDKDRALLESLGVSLSGQSTVDAANELLYVYRAMTLASEKLVLIYRAKQISGGGQAPSLAFRRVAELFPNLEILTFDSLPPSKTVYERSGAFESISSLKNTPYYASLCELLSRDPDYRDRMDVLDDAVTDAVCQLKEATTSDLFGDRLTLTQSQIEKYVSCHFSYYCTYVLKLRDDKRASFDYSNIGTFIHKVLEIFLQETGKDTIDADRDMDKIREIIHREISEQSPLFIPKDKASEGRILHLLLRFYRLASLVAVNLCREQKYSRFVSKLYEAEFGDNRKLGLKAPELVLKDGTTVDFRGKIDRVDTYRHGGNMYIRVVDYKTGAKAFSIDDIKEGYSLQLLLYLFAICDTDSSQFRKLVGCEDGDVLTPAGALYVSMAIPRLKREMGDSDETTLEAAAKEIKRSGLLLNDPETLQAMSSTMDSNMLAGVKVSAKDGTLKGKALADENTFALLKEELTQTVCRFAGEIKAGNANAKPKKHSGLLACAYCEMKPFCRVDQMKASEKKEKENET
ncbi:MAG: exodeoxyribonuclease V subunit gamma [Clostridia bacterium]|nr:exodeoxyribonuclease V subunit gamma [Clostridia bacterium]